MRAIFANVYPATNHKPRRIRVSSGDAPRKFYGFDGLQVSTDRNEVDPYARAVLRFCRQLGWPQDGYVSGSTKEGYVFVRAER